MAKGARRSNSINHRGAVKLIKHKHRNSCPFLDPSKKDSFKSKALSHAW